MIIEEEHEASLEGGLSNDDYLPKHPSILSSHSRSKEIDGSHLKRLKA